MEKINLIIPMNGLGNRFREEDYQMPKPLINVLGKPMLFWLLDNLNLSKLNSITIPYTSLLDAFSFQNQLKQRYPQINFNFLPLSAQTKGAAETVLIALNNLNLHELDYSVMVMDCDTFYFEDVISLYLEKNQTNQIFCFDDLQTEPIYSYIKVVGDNVTDIAEKNKISNLANSGIYCFESGELLKKYCQKIIDENQYVKGEFYISLVYSLMLQDKINIGAIKIKNLSCVGTPMQLKIFCENYQNKENKRFCFDLDNTLVTSPTIKGDYTTCQPIQKNIDFLRYLKNQGHEIIIHTARRMKTHKYNLGAVIKDIGLITLEQLNNFDIPYDEILFGKPLADFYIDDLAINCNLNLEKQIGFYNSKIKSRAFNSVEILDNLVIKSGQIDGERYYYKQLIHYPTVSEYFPKFIEETNKKIIIEKVQGLNFSYLYTNRCLGIEQFKVLLNTLKKLHDIKIDDISSDQLVVNTINKIRDRYKNYDYSKFHNSQETYDKIIDFIKNLYTQNFNITMIHGDPVFTNVIINSQNELKMIDMRGKVGDLYTVGGDPIYDLSKIYQSLVGYDFVINNTPISIDARLLDYFEKWINKQYSLDIETVKKYTASLYFTLIPLHNDEKCQQYYQMAKNLIS